MINVVNYHPDHLRDICLKSVFKAENIKEVNTQAITLMGEKRPYAIVGGKFIYPGVFRVWALISEDVYKIPMAFHRMIIRLISNYAKAFNIRRMEMEVSKNFQEGLRWASKLGFKPEGLMEKYMLDGTDAYLMARVF